MIAFSTTNGSELICESFFCAPSLSFMEERCRDSLDILPAELWTYVAEQSPASWYALCRSLRWLGLLYSFDATVQQKLMDRWVDRETGLLPNGAKHGIHVYKHGIHVYNHFAVYSEEVQWFRNGVLHRDGDLPAVKRYRADGHVNYAAWYRNGTMVRKQGRWKLAT